MAEGDNYHFYQCLNGLVDVAMPIMIKGEHIANLFSGQFFFEEPDDSLFQKQATKYGFNKESYLKAFKEVPVVSKEKVKVAMDFLLNMTQMISEITFQKLEVMQLNEAIIKSEQILRLFVEHSPASIAMFDNNMRYLVASHRFLADYDLGEQNLIGRSHYDVFPEISEHWKEFHRRSLAGETLKNSNDPFPRTDGKTDWVRWEIRPWFEAENQIGGIILFSEVITSQIEDREALKESEKYNRMLFELSAIGLAVASLDGKLVDINPTFASIIGRTIEETKSLTYWDITPISYREQEQQQLESLVKTGKYGPYEKEYIHKDGHLVPVRLQGLYIERNNEKFIWSSVEDITEHKLAESKLLANNKLLTNTLESMSDAFVSLDRNWCYTYMNEKAGAIFGRNPKEMIGKNIWTEFPEGVGQPFQLNYEKAMNEKVFIQMEEYYPPYDMWFENRINPTDDGISIFFQDITERKLAEEKLKQSETQYRNLIEQAADGILLADTNGNIRKINSAFCTMLGYTEEELLKLNLSETYLPEDRDVMSKRLSEIGESDSIRFERNLIRKDKSIIPVEAIIAKTSHGLTQGIVRDISERKQTEMLLTESERKYRYLFENNPLPMWIYDLQTLKFIEVNEAAIFYYGYSKQEFLNMSIKDIRPEEDIDTLLKDVEQTVTPFNKAGIWRHIKKNGEIIFVEITSHLIEFDKRTARMVMINDISERKKIEESLVESENSLKEAQIIANMGDWEYDLINNTSKWSENCYRLYGLEPYEIIPTADYFRSRIHPDDLHLIDEGHTTILQT
ncbi:MAG: PAS domain S-box protein, partial [Bacteroidota bacterium]|nr:PAS domain S-box protein [Bacteroidota bacterium]